MNILEKILVPVDIESKVQHHIDAAVFLANNYDSTIILLYVLPEDVLTSSTKELAVRYVENELNKRISAIHEKANVRCEFYIEYGSVYETVAYVADLKDVNLIVMPAEQTLHPNKMCIKTERVIRESEVAVFAVKSNFNNNYSRILCPIDFSEPSRIALTNAIRLAKRFSAELTVMHVKEGSVFPKFLKMSDTKGSSELSDAKCFEKIDQFTKKSNIHAVPYKAVVKKGEVADEVHSFLKSNDIQLLIMGTTGSNSLKRMILGSVAEQIMTQLSCSLIVTETEDILEAKLSHEIDTLEAHFKLAENLENNNFLDEAIGELKICLHINDLHLPSYYSLIRIYSKLGQIDKIEEYRSFLDKIIDIQHNKVIEDEIRRNYFTK